MLQMTYFNYASMFRFKFRQFQGLKPTGTLMEVRPIDDSAYKEALLWLDHIGSVS